MLSRLSHAGIAMNFDFDARDGHDFLVMEYVPGGTLEARLASGPLRYQSCSITTSSAVRRSRTRITMAFCIAISNRRTLHSHQRDSRKS